jgi:hypothetical protein
VGPTHRRVTVALTEQLPHNERCVICRVVSPSALVAAGSSGSLFLHEVRAASHRAPARLPASSHAAALALLSGARSDLCAVDENSKFEAWLTRTVSTPIAVRIPAWIKPNTITIFNNLTCWLQVVRRPHTRALERRGRSVVAADPGPVP